MFLLPKEGLKEVQQTLKFQIQKVSSKAGKSFLAADSEYRIKFLIDPD